jgi:hypothetical protein
MAREAGAIHIHERPKEFAIVGNDSIKAFEALVRADEREACARIAEEPSAATYECTVACGGPAQTFQQRFPKHSHDIAKEIRARGNK